MTLIVAAMVAIIVILGGFVLGDSAAGVGAGATKVFVRAHRRPPATVIAGSIMV